MSMREFVRFNRKAARADSERVLLDAFQGFLSAASDADIEACLSLVGRGSGKALIAADDLRAWGIEASGLPEWLFAESEETVGDLAETISLLIAPAEEAQVANVDERSIQDPCDSLSFWHEERWGALHALSKEKQKKEIMEWWSDLSRRPGGEEWIYLVNRVLLGTFKLNLPAGLVERAISEVRGGKGARPEVFSGAEALRGEPEVLGPVFEWAAEWKWDGIRAQLIKRADEVSLWSAQDQLWNERFPEIVEAAKALPGDLILDGELLAWRDGPLTRGMLEERLGKKKLTTARMMQFPVKFMVFDCLVSGGEDHRHRSWVERRRRAEGVLAGSADLFQESCLNISPLLEAMSWAAIDEHRKEARQKGVEGLVLKKRSASYGEPGACLVWKSDCLSVDAVLLYAQSGDPTEFTLGVWKGSELVPIGKALSALPGRETDELERWIRLNTREKFGPVRSVDAIHVFRVAFDGISLSPRHKCGLVLRSPRMISWAKDRAPELAGRLDFLQGLVGAG